ncbi:MAG: 4Fe-4S dicluster domain-containing protein [bacterium]
MTVKFITRSSFKTLIPNLLGAFHVLAPVHNGDVSFFKRMAASEEIEWLDHNTTRPPKEFFLPPSDELFRFQQHGKKIHLTPPLNRHDQKIIVGVRPCDAAALSILDRVFSEKGIDVLYTALRDNTMVIGQSCWKPGRDCFCTSVGINPADSRNMDIMLTDIGEDRFLAQMVSPKGEDFYTYFSHFFQEPGILSGYIPIQTKEMAFYLKEKMMFDIRVVKEWLDTHFENPFWANLARRCIGCGACTFLCPTCYCFDLTDEPMAYQDSGSYQGYYGLRRRIWDSCSFGHFTPQLISELGRQSRPAQEQRFRQRIMHKFKFFVDRFHQLACVGCGRCRSLCPVGIDLVEVLGEIHDLFYQSCRMV